MKFIKYSLLTLMLFSRLFVCAQTETEEEADTNTIQEPKVVYKTFAPYKSLFQVSFGGNVAVGSFGSKSTPFTDGYATSDLATNINVIYTQLIYQNWHFIIGVKYMRHGYDFEALNSSYLKTYGDTLSSGNTVIYENLGLYGGMGYGYTKGRYMFTANAGVGGLYNFPLNKNGEGISLGVKHGVNSTGNYNGGNYYAGKHWAAMGFLGGGIKILLNSDLYMCADAQYTWSYIKFHYTEWDLSNHTEHDFMDKSVSFESIAFTIGLGAVFR